MGFSLIDIAPGTPYERGLQHGSKARALISAGLERYRRTWERMGTPWERVRERALRYAAPLEKEFGDLLEECRGIASGAGVDYADIMILNCRYELLKFPIPECTTFALLPGATASGHTILGMNWDNVRWMQESALLLRTDEGNGMKSFCITEAGQLVRHGFNSAGIGVVTNNLLSTGDRDGDGVPTNFMRRRILTSRSLEEAAERVRACPRSVSCNLLLASAQGAAADLEVNPVQWLRLEPREGILTHANHFHADGVPSLDRSSKAKFRDARLYDLLAREKGSVTVDYIQECLRDHYKADPTSHEAICKHPPVGQELPVPEDSLSVTIASQIYDLTDRTAWICQGNPCEGEYEQYTL